MKKHFTIQLTNPCHQEWDALPKTGGGLFCKDCNKVIKDFAAMSDEELIRTFSQPTAGSLCGRFKPEQLDKVYVVKKEKPKPFLHTAGLLLLGLLALKLPAQAPAKQKISTYMKPPLQQKRPAAGPPATSITLCGRVTDAETGEAVFTRIHSLAAPNHTVFTDTTGYYEITVPCPAAGDTVALVFTAQIEQKKVYVDVNNIPGTLNVQLQSIESLLMTHSLGGAVVTVLEPPRHWYTRAWLKVKYGVKRLF